MAFTETERRRLAAKAQSLRSRLASEPVEVDPADQQRLEGLIDRWQENVADGDTEAFQRRLQAEDVRSDQLAGLLDPGDGPPIEELPEWVEVVTALQSWLSDTTTEDVPPFEADVDPFEHVLSPIVSFAVSRLQDARQSALLRDSALESATEELETRLRDLFLHPLFIEFKTAIRDGGPGSEGDPDSRAGYRAFVRDLLDDGLGEFFMEYAVLSRWTAVIIQQWVSTVEEFTRRLERDWNRLERTFGSGRPLDSVVDVTFHGDRHHDGRRVIAVRTRSGQRFAYKPRDLRPEASYFEFLSWLNDESPLPDLRIVDCIARSEYGWMEWVEPGACESPEDIERYFERVGVLICLLYVLRFTDGNIENIVAEGSQPVVLDLEALVQPELPDALTFGESSMFDIIRDSVLQTSVPPMELLGPDITDVNGIDQPSGEQTGVASPRITDPNTDAMDLEFEDTAVIDGDSLPVYDGETASPYDHSEMLIAGFERAYEFCCDNRDRVCDQLSLFEGLEIRAFCRNTSTYGKVRRPLLTASRLRSGLQSGVRIELLTSWLTWDDVDDGLWTVYEAERDALWRLDIPRFTVNTAETDLQLEDRRLESALAASPISLARERLREMDQRDRHRQVDYLVTAYDTDRLRNPTAPTEGYMGAECPDWEAVATRYCDDIFETLQAASVRTSDGELVWYQRVNDGEGVTVRSLRDDIYDGRLGVGLFAGALASHVGGSEYREFVTAVTDPLLTALETNDARFTDKRLGVGHGLGALVYGFTKLADWLDAPRYLEAADSVSGYITEERLAADDAHDLIGGAAGAILGLLALYRETGADGVLDRAVAAGDALLADRVEIDGIRVWPTHDGPEGALIGAGHGVAGIALALDRLGHVTGAHRFTAAATEAMQFAERHYDPDARNWPAFRFDRYRSGWCSGRAGIGLSRLGMLRTEDREPVRRDVERALAGLDHQRLLREDQLCCGNFSRVEFLLSAAETLDAATYREQAAQLAAAVVARRDETGAFSVPWQTDHWYSKSFFLGEPGVGYSLLRLAGADLPSPLLLE